ncbi:MAG: undecaprenyldiphospho-muramoylpentapeptide beta-N-acetylglucosaminyltransferase [Pseudomonadota bacterium]
MSRAPIMIMAGGTGGHIYPALAIARALSACSQPVIWLGTPSGMESRVVPKAGFDIEPINISGLRGRGLVGWLMAPFRLSLAVWQSWSAMRRHRPRLAIGLGGFVSGPGGIAARLAGVPLVIHEQNAIAGLTNRWLSRWAQAVLQGFDRAFAAKTGAVTVGNPVRADILAIDSPALRYAERKGPLHLLVIGGSQGALALNKHMADALALFDDSERPLVRHQAGSATLAEAQDSYARTGVRAEVTPFIEDMAAAYAWADLVVCRAGALTIAELCSVGLPALLVPFPLAVDDHQTANAQALVDAGAALIQQQVDIDAPTLHAKLVALGTERDALLSRANKARTLRKDNTVQAVLAHFGALLDDPSFGGVSS